MALPEQISSLYDEVPLASEVLDRALRLGKSNLQASEILDKLAEQMHIQLEPLGDAAYDVLWDLLRVLEANIEDEGPWNWVEDIETRRHFRITEAVVEYQTVDTLILAARELGWRRRKVEASDFSDVAKGVRSAFSSLLADKVRQLLEDWRNANVWNHVMENRYEGRQERIARTRRENEKRPLPPTG